MAAGETFQQGQRARDLHAGGMGCNAIARELGVSPATITRWAKREGLSFARAQTAIAVAAKRIDRAAARADIIDRLYLRSQKVLSRLEADTYVYYITTADSTERIEDEDPPALDEKNLAAAIGTYLLHATKLELVDGDAGEAAARGMLADLGAFLGLS